MKLTTTTLCVLLLILATYTSSFAQMGMGKPEDIAAIKNRTLIVVVTQPDEKVIEKLKKKKKDNYIDDYKKAIDTYNDNMKDAVEKFWNFSKKIEYKTTDELEALVKSKNANYAVLRCLSMNGTMQGVDIHKGLNWTYTDFKNGQKEDNDYWKSTTVMEITLIEKADKYFKPVYYVGLQDIFPLESDVIFGLQSVQWYLTEKAGKAKNSEMKDMIKQNAVQLKDKTLIVRKDLTDTKLKTEEIKSVYPYKFEIDDKDVYDQHIINADDGYAVVEVIPTLDLAGGGMKVAYVYTVMDSKSGDWMGYVMPSAGSMMGAAYFGGSAGSPVVNQRVFKELAAQSTGK